MKKKEKKRTGWKTGERGVRNGKKKKRERRDKECVVRKCVVQIESQDFDFFARKTRDFSGFSNQQNFSNANTNILTSSIHMSLQLRLTAKFPQRTTIHAKREIWRFYGKIPEKCENAWKNYRNIFIN